MNRQSIALAIGALILGTTIATLPAAAQNYGRNANDGGLVQVQGDYYAPEKPAAARESAPAHYGRAANDGGLVEAQPSQRQLYNSAPEKTPKTPPHYGRPMNDGGF